MTGFLLFLSFGLGIAVGILILIKQRLEKSLTALQTEREQEKAHTDRELARIRATYEMGAQQALSTYEQKIAALELDADRVRAHYEHQAQLAITEARRETDLHLTELESLRGYATLRDAETETARRLTEALTEADLLKQEAELLMERARQGSLEERSEAQQRARLIQSQAEALLTQATRDAGRIIATAERRASEIGGQAYEALRDKERLESAITAMRNVVVGYGDRYIIPTHSLVDDLAADFGHTAAGESLKAAREQSRRMVAEGEAATCDYVEANRRDTAVRFAIDAFNGRVDAILSRVKHDNPGTLGQEIRDAYSLVNLHGAAFRDARILPAYLDARLEELRWAVVVQELRRNEREEQRRLQEQIREEEKARREYERAIAEAAREEEAIRRAMEKARAEVAHASEQQRIRLEGELAQLNERLIEAEEKNQRALSMAQQTRSGNVYIISNIGSFGEEVFKIGMTRRLEPSDRIKELGDASVPFEFDVHAMIRSDDAPALERLLHTAFDDFRINKVNYRKEFFRIPLDKIRTLVTERSLDATFTMAAEAREYRESQALEKMTPDERLRYHAYAVPETASHTE